MGTNYFATYQECPHCRHPEFKIHIGKSSMGWAFSLHLPRYPSECPAPFGLAPVDWTSWKQLLQRPGVIIRSEGTGEGDGPIMSLAEFIALVEHRPPANVDIPSHSSAVKDPQGGFLRHRLDGDCCIGHGEGPWDYLRCTFR